MSVEIATYVADLSPLDPSGGDPKNQGDDHLRLIKTVLRNTFPNASRVIRANEWLIKVDSYAIVAADDNKTIYCQPSTTMVLTLPTAPYPGWCVRVLRNATAHVVLVQPPAGNINSLARSRCAVPFVEYVYKWTGSEYLRVKAPGEVPPGSIEWSANPAVPLGYALANGQALSQNDNPELLQVWGGTWGVGGGVFNCPNMQDRVAMGMGPSYTFGQAGGEAVHVLSEAEMPAHSHAGTTGAGSNHTHTYNTAAGKDFGATGTPGAGFAWVGGDVSATSGGEAGHTHAFTTASAGSSFGHENRPPFVVLHPIFRLC